MIEGTVSVNLGDPSCKDIAMPDLQFGTLETLIWTEMWKMTQKVFISVNISIAF